MKARLLPGALAVAGLLLPGCGSESQWLVSVATDAPVPQFGDHLVLEVIGADTTCTGCQRFVGVDGPDSFPVSFGVVPRNGEDTVRIRARLYRAEQAGANGLPELPSLIDAIAKLPPLEGETRVAINLSMSCFGVPSFPDQNQTCDPVTGVLASEPVLGVLSDGETQPQAGSWPIAAKEPCKRTVPEGMVCVPGGAFLLGTPRPVYVGADDTKQSYPEHIVQLDAFALDVDEITVGIVRGLVSKGQIQSEPVAKDKSAPGSLLNACVYLGPSDATSDALPINCISHALAEEVCSALGKRLPTEAEWEYTAGNLGVETRYPWGTSGDLCKLALLGMGRGYEESDLYENTDCRTVNAGAPWGPIEGGNSSDITSLGIRNLAGSMAEWMADTFAPYTAPCWQANGPVLVSPSCQAPVPASLPSFSIRGSFWGGSKLPAGATRRGNAVASPGTPAIGFRCAMSM